MIKYVYVLASSGKELETQRHKLRGLFHPDIKFILATEEHQFRGNRNIIIVELDGWQNNLTPSQVICEKRAQIKDYLHFNKRWILIWLTEKDLNR